MIWFTTALLLLIAGGVSALLLNRNDRAATVCGITGALSGTLSALTGAIYVFSAATAKMPLRQLFGVTYSADRLSAIFIIPTAVLGFFASVHSLGYMKEHGHGKLGIYWFFCNATLASMLSVTLFTKPIPFLFAWEMMGLMSFALVAFDTRAAANLKAAWVYLLACHSGAAFLILFFLFPDKAESFSNPALILFIFGTAGFGLKAGFPLLHFWLPEAHPAAPAPISAVMSGAMINLGLYGMFRFVLTGSDYTLYGYIFLALGLLAAAGGALAAFAQSNLKRLLACSSVENMGIISIGIGLGFLGLAHSRVWMFCCGFAGAFIHIFNHAVLKGTLFLGAGEVYRSTNLLDMDRLGGLMKRIPFAGKIFTLSGLSLGGLPPFNGFCGELLIYIAAFAGVVSKNKWLFASSLCAVVLLALTGGAVCGVYAKAVSGVFSGEPRSREAAEATPTPFSIKLALSALALCAVLLHLLTPLLPFLLAPLLEETGAFAPEKISKCLNTLSALLTKTIIISFAFCAIFLLLRIVRTLRERKNGSREGVTWDCGYAEPTARMEYTPTSFAQSMSDWFSIANCFRKKVIAPEGLFPGKMAISAEADDISVSKVWRPLFKISAAAAEKMHTLQSGSLHFYILVMVSALAALLIWGFVSFKTAPASENISETTEEVK